MICVVIKKSCWETTEEILHHITLQKKPTDFRFAMTLKDAVVGNVSNGSLWLQRTSPHYCSFPQRYFQGTISPEDAETTKIVGKFCYCRANRGPHALPEHHHSMDARSFFRFVLVGDRFFLDRSAHGDLAIQKRGASASKLAAESLKTAARLG